MLFTYKGHVRQSSPRSLNSGLIESSSSSLDHALIIPESISTSQKGSTDHITILDSRTYQDNILLAFFSFSTARESFFFLINPTKEFQNGAFVQFVICCGAFALNSYALTNTVEQFQGNKQCAAVYSPDALYVQGTASSCEVKVVSQILMSRSRICAANLLMTLVSLLTPLERHMTSTLLMAVNLAGILYFTATTSESLQSFFDFIPIAKTYMQPIVDTTIDHRYNWWNPAAEPGSPDGSGSASLELLRNMSYPTIKDTVSQRFEDTPPTGDGLGITGATEEAKKRTSFMVVLHGKAKNVVAKPSAVTLDERQDAEDEDLDEPLSISELDDAHGPFAAEERASWGPDHASTVRSIWDTRSKTSLEPSELSSTEDMNKTPDPLRAKPPPGLNYALREQSLAMQLKDQRNIKIQERLRREAKNLARQSSLAQQVESIQRNTISGTSSDGIHGLVVNEDILSDAL